MPINGFASSSSSHDNGIKIDTSLFVQKPYLRTNSTEANIEEDIDFKKNLEKKITRSYIHTRRSSKKLC